MSEILKYWPDQSKTPYQSQITTLNWLEKQNAKYLILCAPVGCHAINTKILMYDGTLKYVQDVKIGDQVMGVDSSPRTVLNLYSGIDQMYKIIPKKGNPFVVNQHHILSLRTTPANRANFDGNNVINISVKDFINKSNDFKNNIKLYRSEGVTFSNNNTLPLDPYFLGLLIGDGSINKTVAITSMDHEVIEEIYEQAKKYNLNVNSTSTTRSLVKTYHMSIKPDIRPRINPISKILRDLKLQGTKSGDKFIPYIYKVSSRQERLELLAGLLDTDGHYNNSFSYCTKSNQLKEDVLYLARSLGFSANWFIRIVKGNPYYDITISGHLDSIPTKIKRKRATPRQQIKRVTVTGFTIEKLSIDNFYGFELDGDHLYMLDDFTVTHNSGKSNLAITYSKYLNNKSYILTPQRILQKQYEDDFGKLPKVDLFSLYGKSNYSCNFKHTNCAIGSLIKPKCLSCTHKEAKEKALKSAELVLNYDLGLLQFTGNENFNKRKLLVCDEAHKLEEYLTEFDSVYIGISQIQSTKVKWAPISDIEKAFNWVLDVYQPALTDAIANLEAHVTPLLEQKRLTPDEINLIQEYNELVEHGKKIDDLILKNIDQIKSDYVLVHDKISLKFKRLYAHDAFHKYLKPVADRFLFMSGTIDQTQFCTDLGIPIEETAFLNLDSEFNKNNRPVIFIPHMKMNVDWDKPINKQNREELIKSILMLLDHHANDKGIIHTTNFTVAEWLVQMLENHTKCKHQIFHHNPGCDGDRNSVIKAFQNTPHPSILISPSITEGLDLKHDLARFGIIAKVPYPYLGDQWIKKRMDLSINWYRRQAIIQVMQACGRIVRTNDDHGTTYILDGSWDYLYKSMSSTIPKWWKEAYSQW